MLVGQTLGPFHIDSELGSGAMGAVYLGRHKANGQKVAVKLIAPGLTSNATVLARFLREVAILKQLEHPNIVKILASGKFHNTPFYVMEFLEGESLDHVIERRGRITWEDLVELGQQLCAGLQHAHDQGIVHRDLKPSNLMILKDGAVKLTDFGIAKDTDVTGLTATNSTVGTASYMSPEQCKGAKSITHKSDLYSMGVMFYELIAGRKPFLAETVMDMFMQHCKGKFERPSRVVLDLPVWLDNLICQLLEKDPDKRPLSAAMVAESLGLVRTKHEQQQSAGVDAAKRRRVDRTDHDQPIAVEDREVARELLGKKKKKREREPFYQRTWFTLSAVGGLLALLVVALYFIFFKAPGADGLYSQAKELMDSGDLDKYKLARQEPIAQFLRYHPEDSRAERVKVWRDTVDREECEYHLYNRRQNFQPAHDAEKQARLALDCEEQGRLDEAARLWTVVLVNLKSNDPELRPWGLVARQRLDNLRAVDDLYKDVKARVAVEIASKKAADVRGDADKLAVEAVRAETAGNTKAATIYWGDLEKLGKQLPDRRWLLLAGQRLNELKK